MKWYRITWIDRARECVCAQDVWAESEEEAVKKFNDFYRFPPKNIRISAGR